MIEDSGIKDYGYGNWDVHESRTECVKMPIRHPHGEVKWIDISICLCVCVCMYIWKKDLVWKITLDIQSMVFKDIRLGEETEVKKSQVFFLCGTPTLKGHKDESAPRDWIEKPMMFKQTNNPNKDGMARETE